MKRLLQGDRGATMVEYAIMVSLVAAVAFIAVQVFGSAVLDLFQRGVDALP